MNRPLPVLLLTLVACASPSGGEGMPAPQPPAPEPEVVDIPPTELEAASVDAPVTLEAPDGALDGLYQALAAAEAGQPDGRALIAQFGDSHTAGDKLTGRMRSVLQARFGDAGRGFVLPGRPAIKHYYARDVRYGNDGKWKADQGGKRDTAEPYGLGGVRTYSKRSSDVAWVETCPDCEAGTSVARFEVFYLRQPDGGVLEARVDEGDWQRIHTALGKEEGELARPDYALIEVPDGAHRLSLRPRGSKEVDVFGVAMERAQPGVVVDSLGIVGLMMSHLWKWDWTVIGAQLAHRDPALVVLQYGTNEVDDDDLDLVQFETRYTELIGRIRAATPDAAILILGPPDMATRANGKKCDKPKRRKKKRAVDEPEPVDEACLWKTPPQLLDIIAAERRVAQATGVAFFDSFAAMGGADQFDLLVKLDPPLGYPDHVHFTGRGYEAWADLLLEDLMRGYAAWQKQSARRSR